MISTEIMSRWQALDASHMLTTILQAPQRAQEHLERGFSSPLSLSTGPDPEHILVCGMGGSGSTGDFLQAACVEATLPITVHKSPLLPRWVNEKTLVICVSYSGNTAETLGCLDQALNQKAQVHLLTSGGALLSRAKQEGFSHVLLNGGLPPRAALFDMLFALLGSLADLPFLNLDKAELSKTPTFLASLAENWKLHSDSAPFQLAQQLKDMQVQFWGRSGGADTLAMRWKNQLAENAKMMSHGSVLPELNHNEIVPLCYEKRPLMALVYLGINAEISPYDEISLSLVSEYVGQTHQVMAKGNSPLERLLSLVYMADFVSVYLSYLREVDPTPIAAIDTLKQRMSEVAL